jgi:hypothetical protein
LEHAYPISVQVDALIGLVAAFHPTKFRMYWTRENIAHLRFTHISTIWEGCIKCYLPTRPIYYLLAAFLLLLLLTCLAIRSKNTSTSYHHAKNKACP